jgi:hypothetical protein
VFQLTRLTVNFSPDQKIKFRPTPKHKFNLFSRNIKHMHLCICSHRKIKSRGSLCRGPMNAGNKNLSYLIIVFPFAMYLRPLKVLLNKNLIYFFYLFTYLSWQFNDIYFSLMIMNLSTEIGIKRFTYCRHYWRKTFYL